MATNKKDRSDQPCSGCTHQRTQHDRNRPLLQVPDPLGKIRELYAARDPLYREVAQIVFEGGRRTPSVVARQLELEILKRCEP